VPQKRHGQDGHDTLARSFHSRKDRGENYTKSKWIATIHDMNSPFPGMDLYLERSWGDLHLSLIVSACDSLNERLPEDLAARAEERPAAAPADATSPRPSGSSR
jgi:hypothetical protein